VVLASLFVAAAVGDVRIRREIRGLSSTERQRVFNALHIMKHTSQEDGEKRYGPMFRNYDSITVQHAYAAVNPKCDQGHFGPAFFTFHRVMVLLVEESLLAVDPAIEAIPYWNFNEDFEQYEDPSDSVVWTDSYFGESQGDVNNGWQIRNGPWANWTVTKNPTTFKPNPFGFLRGWGNMNNAVGLTRAHTICGVPLSPYGDLTSRSMGDCIKEASFHNFFFCMDHGLEGPHPFLHIWLGGSWGAAKGNCAKKQQLEANADLVSGCLHCPPCSDDVPMEQCKCARNQTACDLADSTGNCQRYPGGDFRPDYRPDEKCEHCQECRDGTMGAAGDFWDGMTSPNDPIFWFHHPNVDRAFTEWQRRVGRRFIPDGPPYFGFPESGHCPGHNLNDVISPTWPFNASLIGKKFTRPLTNADLLEATQPGFLYTYDTIGGSADLHI